MVADKFELFHQLIVLRLRVQIQPLTLGETKWLKSHCQFLPISANFCQMSAWQDIFHYIFEFFGVKFFQKNVFISQALKLDKNEAQIGNTEQILQFSKECFKNINLFNEF